MNRKTIARTAGSFAKALCLAGMLTVPAYSNASNVSIEEVSGMYILKAEDSTVKEVFDYIQKHSKYVFAYDQSVKDRLNDKVSMDVQGKSVDVLLSEVCRLAGLKYQIRERQVSITANNSKSTPPPY